MARSLQSAQKLTERVSTEELDKNEEIDGNDKKDQNQHKEQEGLAYKDMSNLYYYLSTILLFFTEAAIACVVKSVDDVFSLLAAIAVTCLGFLFPSMFYLFAEKRWLLERQNLLKKHGNENL